VQQCKRRAGRPAARRRTAAVLRGHDARRIDFSI
jgi:hypothetical protein